MKIISYWKSSPNTDSPYCHGDFVIRITRWLLDFLVGASWSPREDFELGFSISRSRNANADLYLSAILTLWKFSIWIGVGPSILWRDPKAYRVTTSPIFGKHDFITQGTSSDNYACAGAFKYTAPDTAPVYFIVVSPIADVLDNTVFCQCFRQNGWEYLTHAEVLEIRKQNVIEEDVAEEDKEYGQYPFETIRFKDWVKYLI